MEHGSEPTRVLETSSETENMKRENECIHTLSEDIYSTHDNLLSDINIGSYSEDVQNQPANRISSLRQFEPICKFHHIEAFHDEMTFQNLTEDFSHVEKSEFQIQAYNDAEDTSLKQNLLQEENPVENTISANKDHLDHECVRKSPRNLSLNYYGGETLQFTKQWLAKNTAGDSAHNPSQPQIFLYKESICRNSENASYHDNNFDLDLRINYKTKKPEVSSKEIQNSREISEMPVSHQEELTDDAVESPDIFSSWSPRGVFKSGGASQKNSMTHSMKQNFESLQTLEEDMALNEILKKLRHANKAQEVEIQDLQDRNLHLENKVKELQTTITKQQVFLDIINKLKENIEELIGDKYNVILEKNELSKKLQDLEEISANTKKHLKGSKKEKETLQLQVKNITVNCIHLQERYIAEIQQKSRAVSQCVEMEKTLSRKDEELQHLEQLQGHVEKAADSALDLLKGEKEIREQEFFFQEEFQKREKEGLKERRKLKSRIEKLIAQVKNLLSSCESERAKNTKLQQQIDELKSENAELQQQVAKNDEQNCVPNLEIAPLAEQVVEVMETDSDRAQDITIPEAEHCPENKTANDIMLQKLKTFQLRKRDLDKEITKLGSLLESKEDHYSRLIEENDKYRRQITSYEEIIKCADQRLEVSHSQIAHLEERNRHLEDLIRLPREKVRKPRPRIESHPKSMTLLDHLDGHCKECSISMKECSISM